MAKEIKGLYRAPKQESNVPLPHIIRVEVADQVTSTYKIIFEPNPNWEGEVREWVCNELYFKNTN